MDGQAYSIGKERQVLELCLANGIELPHLCNQKGLSVETSCGLCFIEQRIQGQWLPVLACVLVPQDGIEIRTESESISTLRRLSAMNLLRIHSVRCETCSKLGSCFLRKIYRQVPCGLTLELAPDEEFEAPVALGQNSLCIDRRKCIGCGLCVRYVQEVLGEDWLSIETLPHGFRRIDAYPGIHIPPEENSSLMKLCPVQALSDRRQRSIRVYDTYKMDHGLGLQSEARKNDLWPQRHRLVKGSARRPDIPLEFREAEARRELVERRFREDSRLQQPLIHGKPSGLTSALSRILAALSSSRCLGFILSDDLCLEDLLLVHRWCLQRKPGKIWFVAGPAPERRYPPTHTMGHRVFSDLGLGNFADQRSDFLEIHQATEARIIDAICLFGDIVSQGLNGKALCAVPSLYMGPNSNTSSELCDFVLPTALPDERDGWTLGEDQRLRAFRAEKRGGAEVYPEWQWMAMMINLYADYPQGQWKYMNRTALWSELQIFYPALGKITDEALPSEGLELELGGRRKLKS
ncbi:MAG: (2Fe-2S)-binding protein [Puniceicoccales bacterium]|nr:(2Fe-2S)-binding protein [Puniceicoccales bacterium]